MSIYTLKVDQPAEFNVGQTYRTFVGSVLDAGTFTVVSIDEPRRRIKVRTTDGWVPVNARPITYNTTSLLPGNSFQLEAVSLRVGTKVGTGKLPTSRRIGRSIMTDPNPGPQPPAEPLYWFEADYAVTVDAGTGRVTEYDDRASHHWNMLAQNAFGAPLPGPRFDLNVQNGLPGLYYSDTGPGTAVGVTNHFSIPADVPLPSDDPVTVLAVVRRDNSYGGIVVTHRMTDISHQFGLWNNGGGLDITAMVTSSPSFILDDQNTHIGETILVSWTYFGAGAPTPVEVRINDVLKTGHWNSTPLAAGGAAGFALGNVPSQGASRGFSGWECAVMAYLGTASWTRDAATRYLATKYGVAL